MPDADVRLKRLDSQRILLYYLLIVSFDTHPPVSLTSSRGTGGVKETNRIANALRLKGRVYQRMVKLQSRRKGEDCNQPILLAMEMSKELTRENNKVLTEESGKWNCNAFNVSIKIL